MSVDLTAAHLVDLLAFLRVEKLVLRWAGWRAACWAVMSVVLMAAPTVASMAASKAAHLADQKAESSERQMVEYWAVA